MNTKVFLTTEGQEVCTEDMEEIVLKVFARGRYHQASAMFIFSKTNTDGIEHRNKNFLPDINGSEPGHTFRLG